VSDNLPDFLLQLGKEAQALPANLVVTAHRVLHLEALRRVVLKTPVNFGTARANWQSTLDAPASGKVAVRSDDEVIAEGQRVVAGLQPYSASFIANNSDHIEILELGGFVPADPESSTEANKKRRASRSSRDRWRAAAVTGDEGGPLVRGGYSLQAPQGMVGITVEELRNAQVE
jgi:hypothetical protein